MAHPDWLTVTRGEAPLLVSLPHTGRDLREVEDALVSPWLGRRDTDWWIDRLYDFASDLGATVVHTAVSRTVIDVNRDPSGTSLYPGQTTTTLCPLETFDGDPLYKPGREPDEAEIARRHESYFEPYHAALSSELARLRDVHAHVVLYDCHSIRSVLPRLFDGTLPVFNLGTNGGASADQSLESLIAGKMVVTGESAVVNGRFRGGWITRHHGLPERGIHAVQMELSNRGYLREPDIKSEPGNWPVPFDRNFAEPMRAVLVEILASARDWALARN